MSRYRTGLAAAVAAYVLWGLFPLYWPLLEPAAPVEILAHRIAWSLVFLVAVLALTSGFRWLRGLGRRRAGLLLLAAMLVSVNWATFIYGVNSGHVVETSLGYFINPLVTVALAVAVLHEPLRRNQRLAVAIAAVAVAVLAIDYGRLPWIALTLAFSFGLYGLVKKRAGVDGTQSLAVETSFLVLPALVYLLWLGAEGSGTFTTEGGGHMALLAGAGVTTAVPLMLFGAAAIRVPLAQVGLLQYIAPVMQFVIGVLVYGEDMPPSRLVGFALVWVALVVFATDAGRLAFASRGIRPEDGEPEVHDMPAKKQDLPSTLERSPKKVQRTYEKTLDSAEETYDSEERAHRAAWSSVKHVAEKKGDHWELKDEKGPSDPQAEKGGAEARRGDGQTAGGVNVNKSKDELYEDAKEAGIEGRSDMTKDELADELRRHSERETRKARS